MAREIRVEREYRALCQGGLSHADFRALFDAQLIDMEYAQVDIPNTKALHRDYLTKLNSEIRSRVMSKDWRIDGEDSPPRRHTTYQELGTAVGLMLEERADVYATGQAQADSVKCLNTSPH